jgi:hypothetical protein
MICIPGQFYDDLVEQGEDIAQENPTEEEDWTLPPNKPCRGLFQGEIGIMVREVGLFILG